MKRYELLGGGTITASTPEEFVNELNARSFFGSNNDVKLFMKGVAVACKLQTGATIRTKNYIVFLHDLKRKGFVSELRQA